MNPRNKKILETDLYNPIKNHLELNGYSVQGEVADCDVVARKNDETVIIELKTTFSIKLLTQAVKRQDISDSVYVAIPFIPGKKRRGDFKDMYRILKRLSLGLIFVRFLKTKTRVEIIFHPGPYQRRKNNRKKNHLIREFSGRLTDENTGGSTSAGKKITLYRQEAVRIALLLDFLKEASPKILKEYGCSDNTTSVLYQNHYGWFERVRRGIYSLHPHGRDCIQEYPELIKILKKSLKNKIKI